MNISECTNARRRLGVALRAARKFKFSERKHTLTWFAKEIGVVYNTLSGVEMGAPNEPLCDLDVVERYLKALELDEKPFTVPWKTVKAVYFAIEGHRRVPVEGELAIPWGDNDEGLRLDRDSLLGLWMDAFNACTARPSAGQLDAPPEGQRHEPPPAPGTAGAPAPSMPSPSSPESPGGRGAEAGRLTRHATTPDQDKGAHPHEEDRTARPEEASGVPPVELVTARTDAHMELPVLDGGSPLPSPTSSPRRRKRRWLIPVALPVMLVIAVLMVTFVNLDGDSDGQPSPTTHPTANAPQVEIRPGALAIAPDGSVYIAEPATHQVRVVRPDGRVLPFANASGKAGIGGDRVPAQEAGLDTPSGVAVGSDGTVYIADTGNRRVRKVKDAIVETVPGTEGISEPFGLTVGPNNDLYVTDKATHRVLLVRKDGTAVPVAGNGRSGPASLNFPHGIAADPGGLYIADRNNHVVRRVPLTGATRLITFAGTGRETGPSPDGGRATDAVLSQPVAVAVSGGDVYIVESGTKRVRRVRADGTITSVATGELTLSSPTGIAIDARGLIYVADSNRLIQIAGGKATAIATHGPR